MQSHHSKDLRAILNFLVAANKQRKDIGFNAGAYGTQHTGNTPFQQGIHAYALNQPPTLSLVSASELPPVGLGRRILPGLGALQVPAGHTCRARCPVWRGFGGTPPLRTDREGLCRNAQPPRKPGTPSRPGRARRVPSGPALRPPAVRGFLPGRPSALRCLPAPSLLFSGSLTAPPSRAPPVSVPNAVLDAYTPVPKPLPAASEALTPPPRAEGRVRRGPRPPRAPGAGAEPEASAPPPHHLFQKVLPRQ